MIGAERGHCQICQAVMVVDREAVDMETTSELSGESVRSVSQREMEKSATSVTGSEKDLCHQSHNQSVPQEREVVHEQTTAQEEKVSGKADLLLLHGVRVAHQGRKMALDHLDVNSRRGPSLSEPQLLLSKTASGALRCDLMHLLQSLQSHLVMEARHLRPQHHPTHCQLVAQS